MDVSIRNVPPDLWYRVRKAAGTVSTPEKRVTIREFVLEALRRDVEAAERGEYSKP